MSNRAAATPDAPAPAGPAEADAPAWQSTDPLPTALQRRDDGVYLDVVTPAPARVAAVNYVFGAHAYLAGIDYPLFIKALYDYGPALPAPRGGDPWLRLAAGIVPFDPRRRGLYKAVKIANGQAVYVFEPVFYDALEEAAGAAPLPQPSLDFDEFVADMWLKGIRFGIDAAAVRAVIGSGKTERVTVARRQPATEGHDAHVVEVSPLIHRDDTPHEGADGKLDWLRFKNRFPQVKPGVRLLQKIPRTAGAPGFELSGLPIEPKVPRDLDLGQLAGVGTHIVQVAEGEFLAAEQEGYLAIDGQSGKISVTDKIVSRDGVSGRTTGNLHLAGAYEEFGDVQEARVVDGADITIHGDVYGHIQSRGGAIALNRNVVGGSAANAAGDIVVKGVASGAVLQTKLGEVNVARAEGCVISGTRVVIGHASNCEIMADEVVIELAEGCAVAARRMRLASAGPRKQSEMLLFPLVPDLSGFDKEIADGAVRLEAAEQLRQRRQREMDQITGRPDLRSYMTLASKLRKNEVALNADQLVQFQKMASNLGPALRSVGELVAQVKHCAAQQAQIQQELGQLRGQKQALAAECQCAVQLVCGEILVRSMTCHPDGRALYDHPAKDLRAKLRAANSSTGAIFSGASGSLDWTFGRDAAAATSISGQQDDR